MLYANAVKDWWSDLLQSVELVVCLLEVYLETLTGITDKLLTASAATFCGNETIKRLCLTQVALTS